MLEQIRTDGFARVRLKTDETDCLVRLYERALRFFAVGPERNSRYSTERLTNGYRPPGTAYNNGDPVNEFDVNDSFLYWNPECGRRLPYHEEIAAFLAALEGYRVAVTRPVIGRLLEELAHHYHYRHDLSFEEASVLQVNSYDQPTSRVLGQTPHEDGVLATVIWASAAGLESVDGNVTKQLDIGPDEVAIMPGSILTVMTGDEIKPLYHQVRNHDPAISLHRKSIMYFSCPDIDKGFIEPYVVNDTNSDVDIRDAIRSATDAYGLAADFVTDH
ncbi:hypothetical protein OG225_27490 [Nocardia sp. NBC_01377]|uniref:2OG-Fe(II) oxygenase family protein n=1 Tax=Nocardia sp. NBC_01377 TaxID=2903595 RepID=UPI00324C4707